MESILDVRNLRFGWPGANEPLLNIEELLVSAGEKVFLQGASGSGKSTLLNLIGGVLSPQAGDVKVLGRSLSSMSSGERDQFRGDHMGFIFQMFNLLPYFSALENVLLPCQFSRLKSSRVIGRGCSLHKEAARLFSQLKLAEADLHRKVIELSVGQQQRVATVRALMGEPELIIADEPTSALDAENRNRFIDLLFSEAEHLGSTLIFVSHDLELGQKFDRTLFLNDFKKLSSAGSKEIGESQ